MRKHLWWVLVAGGVVLLDQASKIGVDAWLHPGQIKTLLPSLNLLLAYNQGAAFSMLNDAGGWQRWFFTGLSFVVSVFIVIWLTRIAAQEKLTALAMSMVLGGAIGNLIDRVIYGHVIDFIDFYYHGSNGCLLLFQPSARGLCHWPTFNVADSAISIGAVLLLISSLRPRPVGDT